MPTKQQCQYINSGLEEEGKFLDSTGKSESTSEVYEIGPCSGE